MSSALFETIAFIGGTALLGALILAVDREPFRTLNRWLTAGWSAVYRWTGAEALDRWIEKRLAPRRIAHLQEILALLPDGPQFDISRARLTAAIDHIGREAA